MRRFPLQLKVLDPSYPTRDVSGFYDTFVTFHPLLLLDKRPEARRSKQGKRSDVRIEVSATSHDHHAVTLPCICLNSSLLFSWFLRRIRVGESKEVFTEKLHARRVRMSRFEYTNENLRNNAEQAKLWICLTMDRGGRVPVSLEPGMLPYRVRFAGR